MNNNVAIKSEDICISRNTDLRDKCGYIIPTTGSAMVLCLEGFAVISVDSKHMALRKGQLLITGYEMTLIPVSVSKRFLAQLIVLPLEICEEAYYKLSDIDFWNWLLQNPILTPNPSQRSLLSTWYYQMDRLINSEGGKYTDDLLCRQACNFFMALSDELSQAIAPTHTEPIKERSWYIIGRLFALVSAYHKEHHDVAYYASRLAITAEYLCHVCEKYYDTKPKKIIDGYLVSAIKEELSTGDLSVKSIADKLNFSDPSYMSRFFKRHTAMSPKEFRRQLYDK